MKSVTMQSWELSLADKLKAKAGENGMGFVGNFAPNAVMLSPTSFLSSKPVSSFFCFEVYRPYVF